VSVTRRFSRFVHIITPRSCA